MIGVCVSAKKEWRAVMALVGVLAEDCKTFPFGDYFFHEIDGQMLLFYRSGARKMNASASTQYMIDHFNLKKIIVIGTCAGIDDNYKPLDIFVPNKLVQCDCTIKESEQLLIDEYTVEYDLGKVGKKFLTGTIATADRAVVMWNDYLELKENNITIADMESAAIAFVARANGVESVVIKGISDFPINENESSKEESYKNQYNTFTKNIPIIMEKILQEYLVFAIENNFDYRTK